MENGAITELFVTEALEREQALFEARSRAGGIQYPPERIEPGTLIDRAHGIGVSACSNTVQPAYLAGTIAYTRMQVLCSTVLDADSHGSVWRAPERVYHVLIDDEQEVVLSETLALRHFRDTYIPPCAVEVDTEFAAYIGGVHPVTITVLWSGRRDESPLLHRYEAMELRANTREYERLYLLAVEGVRAGFVDEMSLLAMLEGTCRADLRPELFAHSVEFRLVLCRSGLRVNISDAYGEMSIPHLLDALEYSSARARTVRELQRGSVFPVGDKWFVVHEVRALGISREFRLWTVGRGLSEWIPLDALRPVLMGA